MITGGNLHIIDSEGRRRTSRRAKRVLEVLSTSPDEGITPSHTFIEDAVADYCLDGNALIVPSLSSDGMLQRLRRMSAWDSDMTYAKSGEPVYRLAAVDSALPEISAISAREVIHVRWPSLVRYASGHSIRRGFAMPPVIALRPALDIGLQGDDYIREWFRAGAKTKLHVDFELPPGKKFAPEQRTQASEWVKRFTSSREPLTTFGAKSYRIDDTPQDREAKELRDFQVIEIARYFGIPGPVIGSMVTEWGPAIEQLAKLFWRFGLRHHMERFLAPFQVRLLRLGDRFWVDTTDLLRGDADAVSKLVTTLGESAQGPAYWTREEIRELSGKMIEPMGTFGENTAPESEGGEPSEVDSDEGKAYDLGVKSERYHKNGRAMARADHE